MLQNPIQAGRIRTTDVWGSGHWHAPRGDRLHYGVDIKCSNYNLVVSPLGCRVVRLKRPYGDAGSWDWGVLLRGRTEPWLGLEVTLFYVRPLMSMVGKDVEQGDVLGLSCSLQGKYPAITDHIHMGVRQNGVVVDPTPLVAGLG